MMARALLCGVFASFSSIFVGGLKSGGKLRWVVESSSVATQEFTGRDAVVSWAWYKPGAFMRRYYVNSLRMAGFDGQILLGTHPDMASNDKEHFLQLGVTLHEAKEVPCELPYQPPMSNVIRSTCVEEFPHLKMESARFAAGRRMLEDCKLCTGWVFISDFEDVHFQRPPFQGLGSPEGKLIFIEEYLGGPEPVNRKPQGRGVDNTYWFVAGAVESCYGRDAALALGPTPTHNVGTTLGSRELMLEYLARMQEEFESNVAKGQQCDPVNTPDQAVHNYLFYTGAFDHLHPVSAPYGTSPVISCGMPCTPPLGSKKDHSATDIIRIDDGWVLNDDGAKSNIVHQAKVCWDNLLGPFVHPRFQDKTAEEILRAWGSAEK